MASTRRTKRATKRSAELDKPRERARIAEAKLELAKLMLDREIYATGQYRAALRALMTEERFASLDEALAVERLAAWPLSPIEEAIEEIPF